MHAPSFVLQNQMAKEDTWCQNAHTSCLVLSHACMWEENWAHLWTMQCTCMDTLLAGRGQPGKKQDRKSRAFNRKLCEKNARLLFFGPQIRFSHQGHRPPKCCQNGPLGAKAVNNVQKQHCKQYIESYPLSFAIPRSWKKSPLTSNFSTWLARGARQSTDGSAHFDFLTGIFVKSKSAPSPSCLIYEPTVAAVASAAPSHPIDENGA